MKKKGGEKMGIEEDRAVLTELYCVMADIAKRGKIRAESFKECYGEWASYDTHGYVESFLNENFVF